MADMRVGAGNDLHRLRAGGPLVLAGVAIPAAVEADGHSDADVVLHAVTDAVLGGAALGDIGRLFPDTDPAYRDADSMLFLTEAVRLAGVAGYRVGNVDVTIRLETPQVAPHIDAMRERLAGSLGIDSRRVGIKAKTGEGIGPIGRGEAVACDAVVLLKGG
ncbi:MAG: 2-C-methyl-D-erythritol 2,4-cyclodiphosphate synthase [Chloroflexota bacterium]|nr:2-C-methyl-D-erythritol 2,4-cyclodiphosphate synthase [Chloroflexota bacterium]